MYRCLWPALALTVLPLAAQNQLPRLEDRTLPFLPALRAGGANQSFLGVAVEEVDANRARDLKLKDLYGVEITRIEEDSAASKAGLKVGDVVIEYNGQKVEGNEQFIRLVRETPPGRDVRLLVSRNGAPVNLTAVMGSHRAASSLNRGEAWFDNPEAPFPPMPEMPRIYTTVSGAMLGIEAEALKPQLAGFFGVKEGVLVRAVVKDSAAEKAGLRAGDVLVKVDQTAVSNLMEVTGALRAARAKKMIPVEAVRDKKPLSVTVDLEAGQLNAPKAAPKGRSVKM